MSDSSDHSTVPTEPVILVAGATGNAGGAVARALIESGRAVRAVVRRADETRLPEGVDAVVGDLDRPETLAGHLDGVAAAFLLSGYDGLTETLAHMRLAGVQRVVLLSSSAAPGGDLDNAIARYHILSEHAVAQSGLAWTFLRPNSFMSNTHRWLPQIRAGDVVRLPFAEVPIAVIHPDDLGRAAAAALTSGAHEGRAYRLSGPEALRPAEQVEILARAIGRDLRFEAQPDEEARAEMRRSMPPEYVDAFFDFFAEGAIDETTVHDTVAEITGRPPLTFARWARENAPAFGTSARTDHDPRREP
ncbi:MAG: NAD(P)H-binding protein [Thermoleophilia bacterium]